MDFMLRYLTHPIQSLMFQHEKGFLVDEEGNFNVSYPSSWIKNNVPTSQFTGVLSTPIISFSIPALVLIVGPSLIRVS